MEVDQIPDAPTTSRLGDAARQHFDLVAAEKQPRMNSEDLQHMISPDSFQN
jgi:hypothetical protein